MILKGVPMSTAIQHAPVPRAPSVTGAVAKQIQATGRDLGFRTRELLHRNLGYDTFKAAAR